MRVALAQTDCVLGEVDENLDVAREQVARAGAQGADLVVFPELSLHGYHLGALRRDTSLAVDDPRLLGLSLHGPDVLVGLHEHTALRAYNTAAHYAGGALLHAHRKLYLPNYLAWEERKHVSPGQHLRAYDLPGDHGRAANENGATFWGGSRVVDPSGTVVAQAPKWEPALVTVDIDVHEARRRRRMVPLVAEARLGLVDREVRRLIDEGGDS